MNTHVFLVLALAIATALLAPIEPVKELNEDDIKAILQNYFEKIPDIETKYVINEGISRAISNYYNGSVNSFPLYKISLKIDRTPVKIPWTLDETKKENDTLIKKRYKYVKARDAAPAKLRPKKDLNYKSR